jgi:hypothetical protein
VLPRIKKNGEKVQGSKFEFVRGQVEPTSRGDGGLESVYNAKEKKAEHELGFERGRAVAL